MLPDDLDRDLDAYLAGEFGTFGPDGDLLDYHEPSIALADREAVDRLLAARSRLVRDVTETEAIAKARIAAIEAWLEDRTAGALRRIEWLERQAENYMRKVNAEDPKLKSIKLPHGTLKLSKSRWHVEVDTTQVDDAVLDTLDGLDLELVETKRTIRKSIVTDVAERGDETNDGETISAPALLNGHPIPGVRFVRDAADKFTV